MSLLKHGHFMTAAAAVWCGTGCIGAFFEDALSSILLDYEIDKPRLLAMGLEPPILANGIDTELHALIVGPDGGQATEAVWKTCGLRDDVPTSVSSLQCFAEDTEVSLVGNGSLPASYEMPDLSQVDCDGDVWAWDTGLADSGFAEVDTIPCTHWLPLLVEAELDRETVQGVLHATWFLQPFDESLSLPRTGRQQVQVLAIEGAVVPGETLAVELEVEGDLRDSGFQWYVDAGELEKTSWTATQRYEAPPEHPVDKLGRSWTDNRWTLPEDATGELRIWVVWTQPWGDDTIPVSVPDIVWTSATVVLP